MVEYNYLIDAIVEVLGSGLWRLVAGLAGPSLAERCCGEPGKDLLGRGTIRSYSSLLNPPMAHFHDYLHFLVRFGSVAVVSSSGEASV
jgi:hypothetical protein